MANFTPIGSSTAFSASGTSAVCSYASRDHSTLIVGLLLSAGSVSALADNLGLDVDGNPFNTWQKIDSVSVAGGGEMEFWYAQNVNAIASVTATLSTSAKVTVIVAEYTGIGNFTTAYHVSNVSAASLTLDETSTDNSKCFIGFFGCTAALVSAVTMGSLRLNAHGTGPDAADMGLALADNSITKLVGTFASAQPVQAIGVSFNVGFSLTHIPGFADISDSTLAHDQNCLGKKIASISENAAFGMVRLEVFTGLFVNGDTVPLPVSPIDGYSYSREELTYIWGVHHSANPGTGWISGRDSLWYAAWLVDQSNGAVSTSTAYRRSGGNWNPTVTTDGQLFVVTVAQRLKNSLTMGSVPSYQPTDPSIYVQDGAITEEMLDNLSHNAKYGVTNVEVIYMGEFKNGDTVPQPVSPADGYVYEYQEVAFQHSWRWTSQGSSFVQPQEAYGQLGPILATVDPVTGSVAVSADYIDDSGSLTNRTTDGRIAVFAICSRLLPVTLPTIALTTAGSVVPSSTIGVKIPSTAVPATGGSQFQVRLRVQGVHANLGGGKLTVLNAAIWKLASGSGTGSSILQNVPITFGGSNTITVDGQNTNSQVPGQTQTSDMIDMIFDQSHDYWIVLATDGTLFGSSDGAGTGAFLYDFLAGAAGDHTADTTVPFSGGNTTSLQVFDQIVLFKGAFSPEAIDFAEIDPTVLSPGDTLPASLMKQIDSNAKEAAVTPEVFGPAIYQIGDTVPTPTSLVDGYAYTRSECCYIWEWQTNLNATGSNLRVPAFWATVDQTTGVVRGNVWRLPPGGPYVNGDDTKPRVKVTIIARRQTVGTNVSGNAVSSPADLGSQTTDLNQFLVNGA